MKLYIREKIISVLDHFYVKDEKGNNVYEVKKKFGLNIGLNLHIYDSKGKEVAYIKEKNISVRPKFRVFVNGEHTATIVKKIVALKPKYEVEKLDWKVKGNLIEHDYKIVGEDGVVMKIHKQWLKLTDAFVMEFNDEKHVLEALAVVLAIDSVMDAEEEERD